MAAVADNVEHGSSSEKDSSKVGRPLAQFIVSLYKLVSAPENHALISWAEDGTSFIIKNIDAFSAIVLPKYFKHGNFSSLSRQLCFYAFKKVSKANSNNVKLVEYSHPYFIRGRPDLLPLVVRKTNETAQRTLDAEATRLKAQFGDAPPPEDVAKDLAVTLAGTNALRAVMELESEIRDDYPHPGAFGGAPVGGVDSGRIDMVARGGPAQAHGAHGYSHTAGSARRSSRLQADGHPRRPGRYADSGFSTEDGDFDEETSIVGDDGPHSRYGGHAGRHNDVVFADSTGDSGDADARLRRGSGGRSGYGSARGDVPLSELAAEVVHDQSRGTASRVNSVRNIIMTLKAKLSPASAALLSGGNTRLDSTKSATTVADEDADLLNGPEPRTQEEADAMIEQLKARISAQWARLDRTQRDLVVVAQALRSVALNQPDLMRSVFIPPERVLEITEHIPDKLPDMPRELPISATVGAPLDLRRSGSAAPSVTHVQGWSVSAGVTSQPGWLAPTPLAAAGTASTPHTQAPPYVGLAGGPRSDWYPGVRMNEASVESASTLRVGSLPSSHAHMPERSPGVTALAQGLTDVQLGGPRGSSLPQLSWGTAGNAGVPLDMSQGHGHPVIGRIQPAFASHEDPSDSSEGAGGQMAVAGRANGRGGAGPRGRPIVRAARDSSSSSSSSRERTAKAPTSTGGSAVPTNSSGAGYRAPSSTSMGVTTQDDAVAMYSRNGALMAVRKRSFDDLQSAPDAHATAPAEDRATRDVMDEAHADAYAMASGMVPTGGPAGAASIDYMKRARLASGGGQGLMSNVLPTATQQQWSVTRGHQDGTRRVPDYAYAFHPSLGRPTGLAYDPTESAISPTYVNAVFAAHQRTGSFGEPAFIQPPPDAFLSGNGYPQAIPGLAEEEYSRHVSGMHFTPMAAAMAASAASISQGQRFPTGPVGAPVDGASAGQTAPSSSSALGDAAHAMMAFEALPSMVSPSMGAYFRTPHALATNRANLAGAPADGDAGGVIPTGFGEPISSSTTASNAAGMSNTRPPTDASSSVSTSNPDSMRRTRAFPTTDSSSVQDAARADDSWQANAPPPLLTEPRWPVAPVTDPALSAISPAMRMPPLSEGAPGTGSVGPSSTGMPIPAHQGDVVI